MKLEKLQLFGFKSFADKTEFKFKDSVIGIVGPNGCGKSNIVDAFRWVLGEQSAKGLRGDEMKDVIFNGTTKRKALGFAEATLAFTNAEDVLGEGNDKFSITRRLYRSGESEYMMNGKIVRLKDIKETLAGTGVGFNAYSILEQDKIDKLLSANPEERRLVFEEAAGISGYRAKRKKTERELERTEQYLLRLGDIIGELRSRERSVKIQAGRARRYQELSERLSRLRLDLYMLKFRGHNDRMKEIDEEIERIQREADELEGRVRLMESELARKESSMHALGEHLRGLLSRKTDASNKAVAAEERINYGKQRVEELLNRKEALGRDISLTEKRIEKALGERAEIEKKLTEYSSHETAVEEELKQHRLNIYEVSVHLQELEEEQEKLRNSGTESLERRSAIRNELATLAEEKRRCTASKARLAARRDKVLHDREELALSIEKLDEQLRVLGSRRSELKLALENSEKRLRDTDAAKIILRQQYESLKIERARCQSRLDTLETMVARRAGVGNGARHILSRKGQAGCENVCGLLGELIEVDIDNAAMVEAALGRLAEAVVVDTPETAARLAIELKETDSGSALFAPLTWTEPSRGEKHGDELLERVNCPEEYRSLLERLIGDVRVGEDIEEALGRLAVSPDCRCVTPAGEIVGAGTISGGSPERGGIVHRQSEMASLKKEIERINSDLADALASVEKVEAERKCLDEECTKLSSGIDEITTEAAGVDARRNELLRDCSVAETELRTLGIEIDDFTSLLDACAKRAHDLTAELESVEKKYDSHREELSANVAEAAKAKERRESLMQEVTEVEVRLARQRQEKEEFSRAIEAKDNEISERRQVRTSLESESKKTIADHESVSKDIAEAEKTLEELLGEIGRLGEKTSEGEQQHQDLEGQISEVRRKRDSAAAALRETESKLSEMRIERQACSTQVESVSEYAREELGIDVHEDMCEIVLPDADPGELEEEVRNAREKLGRLGNVNMEALEELEEITARLTFYTNQEQDLIESRSKLLNVMEKIDRKCRVLLERSFKEIRRNFQSVFRKLFNGGRADIYFEDGKDILEAGIDIVAKPPGKDLSSLTLLSGGERAMTTIALLFAIFRSKLSPFCILDEIDAPLDDSNVTRFLQLLREFTGDCRFVIITHNKQSMAGADTLYGITMQEPGVSKRISITFEEAAKHASEAPSEDAQASDAQLEGKETAELAMSAAPA
jgi:chromosome segregation protein